MLTAILWLAMMADRNPTEFAVAVIISGPAEMTHRDAEWWASDPFRVRGYCQAARELGIVEQDIDLRDLVRANGVDFPQAVFEMRWTHARLTRRIDGR